MRRNWCDNRARNFGVDCFCNVYGFGVEFALFCCVAAWICVWMCLQCAWICVWIFIGVLRVRILLTSRGSRFFSGCVDHEGVVVSWK